MKIAQKTLVTILFSLAFVAANAQVELLQKAAGKVNGCKNFSYTALNTTKDIFSDVLTHETSTACFLNSPGSPGSITYYVIDHTLVTNTFTGSYTDIYNGKELILLDLNSKTYRVKQDEQNMYAYQGSVPDLLNTAINDLKSGEFRTILLPDSMVNKTQCYHIKVVPTDTVKLDSRRDFLISKAGNTLVYFRNKGSGEASKGGMSLGTVHIFIEDHFSGYKFDTRVANIADMHVPAGFKTEEKPKPLLNPGDIAPNWELTTTNNKNLSLAKLKGKVVLIDFTGDGCPACMLAIPPLNKLHEKYNGTDVAIISINIDGTSASISNTIKKYGINYPVYTKGKITGNAYHVSAIPNFYLINKQGVISNVHEGFFEDFEQVITSEIEKLR